MFIEASDGLPLTLSMSLAEFELYRDQWLIWRALGHFDHSGSWIPPISYLESLKLPKPMLDVFFELDALVAKMAKQKAKKRKK